MANQNVLYFINSLEIGGAEVGMCRLLGGLDEDKYEITVVALDSRLSGVEHRIPNWVETMSLYPPNKRNVNNYKKLIGLIKKSDVIVGSLFHSEILAKLCKSLNRDALVITWRHNTRFKNSMRKDIFRRTNIFSDAILADSIPVKEHLINENLADESKVHIVPIAGIDLGEYTQKEHYSTDSPVVGTVGRLNEQKNHKTVINVAEKLQSDGIEFKIAGDGNLYKELRREVNRRNINNIELCGYVDDLPQFYTGLDIYFQPSHYEGLCITVIEAMAVGLPIVGSDVGGISRNVENGRNGYLSDPNDVDDHSSAILKLAEDTNLRQQFGSSGRRIVDEKYTQRALVNKFELSIQEAFQNKETTSG